MRAMLYIYTHSVYMYIHIYIVYIYIYSIYILYISYVYIYTIYLVYIENTTWLPPLFVLKGHQPKKATSLTIEVRIHGPREANRQPRVALEKDFMENHGKIVI